MLHQTLLNRLSWFNKLGQSNHFSAVLALSLSLILAACGGGGSSVTENNLVEPGADGVVPTLTSVTIENDYNGAAYVTPEGGKPSTVLIKIEADEALMQPTVTIGGEVAEVNGSVRSWQATREMTSSDLTGDVAFSIAFSDASGEEGVDVAATTDGSTMYYCAEGCSVGPGGVLQDTIDFEVAYATYTFVDFGPDSSTSAAVQDPTDATNTVAASQKKANAETWGGTVLSVSDLAYKLTADDGVMTVNFWSPAPGKTVRLKLENADDANIFVEADAVTTATGDWETLTFDFSLPAGGAIDPATEYAKVAIFYDFGTAGTGTDVDFYWDDVKYGGITNAAAPTFAGRWKLANEAGSAGVGPEAGNVGWWSLGAGDLTARACFMDDVYIFGEDGSFALELGDQTWLEDWQSGADAACGTPIAPHDGTATDYTYTLADNVLTVNGSGAYIGIAKAGNTYANESGGVPTSIEYSVVSMAADYSTMTLAVKVTKDDGATDYWTYKLEQQQPSPIAGRWKLANEVGSAGVGPAAGDVSWWSLGEGDLTARACFMDDVYIFGEYGSFANEQGDQTWLEEWQSGSADVCGAPLAPHNGSVDGTFTYADNKITITGAGNYIGIAKAGNTYAYESGGVPASIEYTVESMNADKTAMTLAVKVTKDDGNIDYWTYKLVKDVPSPIAGRWKLANEAGSFGVGSKAGDPDWWTPNDNDLTARACFMDDVYIFGEYGSFANEQGDQTWLEEWQSGSADACGAPLAPHNGAVDGTFTYADNKITITGAGNYIGIAKAGNTYAYESGGVPASIEYTVQSMNADKTTMTLAVKVTKDDGAIDYWTYKLVKEAEAEASPIAGNWTLAQEVGAAGVGPSAGIVEWWSLGAGDLTARACFMDDVYTFGADGSFSNVQGSETWIENWQSDSDDACGAPLAPHNGSVDGTFTYADNKITITGAGNYIGIAKAGNTYAYESGGVPASIEYSVESMSADYSAMTLAVKVTKDDGDTYYWTYNLVKLDPKIDTDSDGVADSLDAFPFDASESVDTDGDGVGDNADTDDDGDGVADDADDYPLNANVYIAPTATSAIYTLHLLPKTTNAGTQTLASTSQDNRAVSYSIVANGTYGTASITNSSTGAFSYTTTQTNAASDYFTFKVNDGYVDSAVSRIDISLKTDPLYKYQWHLDNTGQSNFASNAGTPGADLNIDAAIASGKTGAGIVVAVVDSGLEIAHEDIADNVVTNGSWNYSNSTSDPTPTGSESDHGTMVAGIIAAKGWNNIGGRGVAPNASIRAFNLLSSYSTSNEANALGASNPLASDVSIFNMSYGGPNTAIELPSDAVTAQLLAGTSDLRNGKGALYVNSTGNDYYNGDTGNGSYSYCGDGANAGTFKISCYDAIFDGVFGLPYIIGVGALDADNIKARYSTPGAATWISAYGGDYGQDSTFGATSYGNSSVAVPYKPAITTIDRSSCTKGYNSSSGFRANIFNDYQNPHSENTNCNYTNIMNGTSSAAPMISGVIALMLETNSALTWRDVKHILATTAVQVDSDFSATAINNLYYVGWITNSIGLKFHPWYGFGAVDATAAVDAAATHTSLTNYSTTSWNDSTTESTSISDVTLYTREIVENGAGTIEHVKVRVSFGHTVPNSLGFRLESPSGTVVTLLPPLTALATNPTTLKWVYLPANAFYGESKTGTWKLHFVDHLSGVTGTFAQWGIQFMYR